MQRGATLEARAEDQKRLAACVVGLAARGGSPASARLLCRESARAGGKMRYSGGMEGEQVTKI